MSMLQQKRLSHALLFLGKEGSGALQLANAFAQYLICDKVNKINPTSENANLFGAADVQEDISPKIMADSCGECPACIKASKFIHPDIHYSFPVITKKAGEKPISDDYIKQWREFQAEQPYGNAFDWVQYIGAENQQGNISARECSEISRKMNLKSFESSYKILIMWMPEMLDKEGNRLLKLIEEPAEGTIIILVAENESLILPTLLSRLQLIKIPRLKPTDIEAALELREGVPVNKAEQIAAISEGNYHEALMHLQHADDDWEQALRKWLNSIFKTNKPEQVKWIEDISKIGREKQKQFLKYFIHLIETAIRIRIPGDMDLENPENKMLTDFASRLNQQLSLEQMEAIAKEMEQAIYYIGRNANAKILFMALSIKLYHIIKNKSVILVH